MSPEQFKEKRKQLYSTWMNGLHSICEEYVLKNAKHQIGDIISLGENVIEIKTIEYSMNGFGSMPVPLYSGFLLKKDFSPRANKQTFCINEESPLKLVKKK